MYLALHYQDSEHLEQTEHEDSNQSSRQLLLVRFAPMSNKPLSRFASSLINHDHNPDDSSVPLYATDSAMVAAAFVAADLLTYSHAKLNPERKRVELFFFDPLGIGEDRTRRYHNGVLPTVQPKLYAELRNYFASEQNRLGVTRDKA